MISCSMIYHAWLFLLFTHFFGNWCKQPETYSYRTRLQTLVTGQSEGQQLVKLAAVNSRPRSSQDRKQSPPVLTLTELEHKLRKKVIICSLCVLCTVFLDSQLLSSCFQNVHFCLRMSVSMDQTCKTNWVQSTKIPKYQNWVQSSLDSENNFHSVVKIIITYNSSFQNYPHSDLIQTYFFISRN